jgi:hypothetical protein
VYDQIQEKQSQKRIEDGKRLADKIRERSKKETQEKL